MDKLIELRKRMSEKDIPAIIVYDELNQRYISGFNFTDGFLLITEKSAHLVTDFRYYEMALATVSSDFEVVMPKNRTEYIDNVLSADGISRLGFEDNFLSVSGYNGFKKLHPTVELFGIGNLIEKIREVKSADEIEKMQRSQDITDAAFKHLLSVITPNMTEIEVAAELEYAMKKLGSESPAFDTVAVSGDASSLPHGTPRSVKLKRGFLTMDFGSKFDGYCSDMTRTIVIGKADADVKKLYDTVLAAQKAALEYLAEGGRDCFLADKTARDIIDADYKGAFGHSLGHSVGLLVHEQPALSPKSTGHLVKGNVVTVEPGIYLFGKYGCRIEDMVAITDGGIHNFTHSEKDLIQIY